MTKKLPQLSDSQNERLAVLGDALKAAGVEIIAFGSEHLSLLFWETAESDPFVIDFTNNVSDESIFCGELVSNGK